MKLYAEIRRYRVDPDLCFESEVISPILQQFVPLIKQSQGLLAYYVLDAGEGVVASITICEDKENVEKANRVATEWMKQYLASNIVSEADVHSFYLHVEEPLQGVLYEGVSEPSYKQALRLLSVNEVAEVLGMGRSWVYQQIRAGEIPSVQLGGTVKVKQKDLEEYVEKHTRSRRGGD
jgi:excisionase family DNA binding protein